MSLYDDLQWRSSGEDSIEQKGVRKGRGTGAGEGGTVTHQRLCGAHASELPAGQAAVETLPDRRCGEAEARQRRPDFQPQTLGKRTPEDPAKNTAASGRHWPASSWPAKTSLPFIRRLCGAGCWKRAYGSGRASASSIAEGATGERTSANWCRWMAASMTGIRAAHRRHV